MSKCKDSVAVEINTKHLQAVLSQEPKTIGFGDGTPVVLVSDVAFWALTPLSE